MFRLAGDKLLRLRRRNAFRLQIEFSQQERWPNEPIELFISVRS